MNSFFSTLIQHNYFEISPCCCVYQQFILSYRRVVYNICLYVVFHYMSILSLFLYPSINGHWVSSTLGLLQIKLLWTVMNKFLYEHIFPFLLDEYPRVEWLDHSTLSPGVPTHLDEVITSFAVPSGCDCLLHPKTCTSFWDRALGGMAVGVS